MPSMISEEMFLPWILEPLDEQPHFLGLSLLWLCTQARWSWTWLWFRRRRGSRQRPGGRWRNPLGFLVLPKGEQVCRFRGHCRGTNPGDGGKETQQSEREAWGYIREQKWSGNTEKAGRENLHGWVQVHSPAFPFKKENQDKTRRRREDTRVAQKTLAERETRVDFICLPTSLFQNRMLTWVCVRELLWL